MKQESKSHLILAAFRPTVWRARLARAPKIIAAFVTAIVAAIVLLAMLLAARGRPITILCRLVIGLAFTLALADRRIMSSTKGAQIALRAAAGIIPGIATA